MEQPNEKSEEFRSVKSKGKKRKLEEDAEMSVDPPEQKTRKPKFRALTHKELQMEGKVEMRKIFIPSHRRTPLHQQWSKIYTPIVENLKLQIRFNMKAQQIQIRSCPETIDTGALQRAAEFVKAFVAGFEIDDAMVLLRLDDMYIETFKVQDVKPLHGDHLGRAVGRLAGTNGATKYTIENSTKTRIILADSTIHILGSYNNIAAARRAICNLILGSPPSKVYGTLRTAAAMSSKRF